MNICKKLPSECPAPFMEAVPILCNLLQYEDSQVFQVFSDLGLFLRFFLCFQIVYWLSKSKSYFGLISQLVENVAICLIRITERLSQSPEKLDELCKHGLIQQTFHLLNSNSRSTLSLPVCNVRLLF